MKALVIGATGATGKHLVSALLEDKYYTEINVFVRRPTGRTHEKLQEHIVDFSNMHNWKNLITGDVVFSCLGTTLKAAGSKENQWNIDFDIPVEFTDAAIRNGVSSVVLLSSFDADSSSKVFYSKMKGNLEEWIAKLEFRQFIIFRPGLLQREGTDRPGEKIALQILKFLNALWILRKYRPMPTKLLAEKLAKAPKKFPDGKFIIKLDEIFNF